MKTKILFALSVCAFTSWGQAFDVGKASTERFRVSYLAPSEELPALTVISRLFAGRDQVLKLEREAVESGATAKELNRMRRTQLEYYHFPIRVTDSESGNTYEVQKDRRTIVAKTKDGKVLWKVNPFEEGKVGTYRFEHPFIVYFGKSTNAVNAGKGDEFLGIAYNSSVFGQIKLTDGSFHLGGND